jgi:hypothetical protein
MQLDALNTIFAGLTFAVISATAIAALVQLRHLRASNQLQGLITVLRIWEDPVFQRYMDFVRNELDARLRDPEFIQSLSKRPVDRTLHLELHVCDMWEQIGSYVKYGLIDERSFMDVSSGQVFNTWVQIAPVITKMREFAGPSLYENFEYLAVRGRLWIDRYPDGNYPAGAPRMTELIAKRDKAEG